MMCPEPGRQDAARPSDDRRAGQMDSRQVFTNAPASGSCLTARSLQNFDRHKNVILNVTKDGKMRTKGEQRMRKGFVPIHRNLLNSFD